MSTELAALYQALSVKFRPVSDPNYERLVVASDANEEPFHRWFRMKEAFSPLLFQRLLKDLGISDDADLSILDPFSGSGTTITSALQWAGESGRSVDVTGYEVNPFLHLLSSVKSKSLTLKSTERRLLADEIERLALGAISFSGPLSPTPELAALENPEYFEESQMTFLRQIRGYIDTLQPSLATDLLNIALASLVEPVSSLRRDGRALRHVPKKARSDARLLFARQVRRMSDDLRLAVSWGSGRVVRGDGRQLVGLPEQSVDIAIFSPPYPNNIDYTEVYKMEAWLLGLVSDDQEFKNLRTQTMRSHPSISWEKHPVATTPATDIDELLSPILRSIPDDRYSRQRSQVMAGYLQDTAALFERLAAVMRPGGRVVYVVGNSRHGSPESGMTVAADLLLAAIAEKNGFAVSEFREARRLSRRGQDPLLRESVVALTKVSD